MTDVAGAITVRHGRAADAPRLSEVAYAAKQHWGYPPRWLALWRDQLTISADYVESNLVWVAESGQKIVGFGAVAAIAQGTYSLEHLWVDPGAMGQGVGRTLLEHMIETLAAVGAQQLQIESDPHAEGFYRHMGARRVGEIVYVLEGQPRPLPLLVIELTPE